MPPAGPPPAWYPPAAPPRPARQRVRAGRIVFWAFFGVVAACLVASVVGVFTNFRIYSIDSGSMGNTLRPGDRLWVTRGPAVRRGDIIVYDVPAQTGNIGPGAYVKRLIGLPGDHVACCDAAGDVTVNGKALRETYLYPGDGPSKIRFSVTLRAGEAWVMGDHRDISLDSRGYGPVPTADIVGWAFQVKRGSSTINVTTPATYVDDGLAAAGARHPRVLVFFGAVVFSALALLALGVLGVTRWAMRRSRGHRAQRSQLPPPMTIR
jgi:signal peptidase I